MRLLSPFIGAAKASGDAGLAKEESRSPRAFIGVRLGADLPRQAGHETVLVSPMPGFLTSLCWPDFGATPVWRIPVGPVRYGRHPASATALPDRSSLDTCPAAFLR